MPLQATSGAASYDAFGGGVPIIPQYIEEVFSTWLYTGNGSTQTITNGIDLSGEGGLVWVKSRSSATDHELTDTVRSARNFLSSNTTAAQSAAGGISNFSSTGFDVLGAFPARVNVNGSTYASWTFRKQPKFFDVVTYTGNGINGTAISHSLGAVPGCIIIKRTDNTGDWFVHHRSYNGGVNSTQYTLYLNTTAAVAGPGTFGQYQAPTSTAFYPGASVNAVGGSAKYVAYLFAHDAGGFGLTGTDNVISCGSYVGSYSAGNPGPTVTLGFEPQFLIIKSATNSYDWTIMDNMRGMPVKQGTGSLNPSNNTVDNYANHRVSPTATGFIVDPSGQGAFPVNNTGGTYIYIAIRRGPMKVPTTGASVFSPVARTGTGIIATVTGSAGVSDAVLIKNRSAAAASLFSSRLTGTGYLVTSTTAAEVAAGATILQANPWDVMDGVKVGTTSTITNDSTNTYINYLFDRAPGFFDVVCYTGNLSVNSQAHNLAAVPELVIFKSRSATTAWSVIANIGASGYDRLQLNATTAATSDVYGLAKEFALQPTSTTLTIGLVTLINNSGSTYVAYLFASCPGVSKVGNFTGTGATQVINCGFTGGARFVLIKSTSTTGDWYVWDSARGIVAGNDPYILLNSVNAQVTNTDWVDTAATGFELSNAGGNLANSSGVSYIFLAIA